ncbi:tektin-1 [Chelonus insularis]|uniref:tektin-1 n=1 Tax=Chelonus insularis TaxID=460826 RepID=UPI00158B32DF|nr:tektin-1 [Chelonus insularis]
MSKKQQALQLHRSTVVPASTQKFTLDQWYNNNQKGFQKYHTQCQLVENLIAESERICEATLEITKTNKIATDRELEEKLADVKFVRGELLTLRKNIVLEIDALKVYKTRLTDALVALNENAAEICEKCLELREHRLGIDLTVDEVEKELRKELSLITGANKIFSQALENTNEQIRILKSLLYYLDGDLANKDRCIQLDEKNLKLKETGLNLNIYHGKVPLDISTITEQEWNLHTNEVVMSAMNQLKSTKLLRSYIDDILKEIINDLNKQKDATNDAFNCRIKETKNIKASLEEQHAEVIKRVNAMNQNITRLEKNIAEKEGFLALAHTRLGNRCHRPNLELTRDQVEKQLVMEVTNLQETVAKLQNTLYEAHNTLRNLLKVQIQLEEDINVKVNTLKIDEVECMSLRQKISYHAY